MAKSSPEEFVKKYRPVAEQVGRELGVDPNVILSQWALESRWGTAVPAENNIAGIKDFTGSGTAAKDNKTGTTDKYARFESPEVFGIYYSDMMQRQFPDAMNTGSDIGAFTKGLTSGRSGSYFEADPENYASGLAAFNKQIAGPVQDDGGNAKVRQPPAETDDELVGIMDDMRLEAQMLSDAEAQEKRQAQIYGAGAGAALATTRAAGSVVGNALEAGARRVGAGLSATSAPQAGALPPAAATTAPPAASAGSPRQTGALPGQTGPRTPPPLPGLTLTGNIDKPYAGFGSGNANYGWKFQLPDIDLGKVASMGSDEEGAQRFIKQRAEGMARARSAAPGSILVERPSGLLETISTGGKPKFSGTQLGPMPTDPGDPRNLFPGLSQPGQVQERTPQAPQKAPTPTVVSKPSGLDYISDKFMGMMRPIASGASTALRYAAPPLALASAAGEGVNIAQQLGRPSSSPLDAPGQAAEPGKQRDYTSMGLSGLNILGAGMSVLPRFSPYGIPLTLGTAAYQAYRDDPKILEKMRQKIFSSDYPEQMAAP